MMLEIKGFIPFNQTQMRIKPRLFISILELMLIIVVLMQTDTLTPPPNGK